MESPDSRASWTALVCGVGDVRRRRWGDLFGVEAHVVASLLVGDVGVQAVPSSYDVVRFTVPRHVGRSIGVEEVELDGVLLVELVDPVIDKVVVAQVADGLDIRGLGRIGEARVVAVKVVCRRVCRGLAVGLGRRQLGSCFPP